MMDQRTSAADAIADEVRAHAVDLLRFDAHVRQDMLRILRDVERELVKRITESEIEGALTPTAQRRLESVLANVRATISSAYGQALTTTTGHLTGLATVEGAFAQAAVNGALGFELLTTAVSPAMLRAIVSDAMIEGAPLKEWFSRLAGDLAQRVADEIRKGMIAGEANADIVKRIRGTRANGYKDGVMDLPKRSAERVVRTAVQTVANQAQIETYRANADVVAKLSHLSVLDQRTSLICVSRSGLSWEMDGTPIGHDKAFMVPPLHWNAVAEGELIVTAFGSKRIEDVQVGDMVLTHLGHFRPVYSTMCGEIGKADVVRVIHTKAGQVLRVTDEHPILTAAQGWKRADEIEVGDELFHDPEQVADAEKCAPIIVGAAEHYPSIVHEPRVFDRVLFSPGAVPAPVHFERDASGRKSEVDRACADNKLVDERGPGCREQRQHELLAGRDVPSPALRARDRHRGPDGIAPGGVPLRHPLAVRGVGAMRLLGESESPMGGPARVDAGSAVRDASLAGLVANGDAVALAPEAQPRLSNADLALNGSNGFLSTPVLAPDQVGNDRGVGKIDRRSHWLLSEVARIETVARRGRVFNLAVEEDETYVASGIVVHNCRSVLVPVTKTWKELGIDLPEVPASTRSSMDGQVARDLSFDDWLKTKDEAFQDKLLGAGKADLWRRGKISLTDLTDQSARPLTLEELRERVHRRRP